MQFKVPQNIDMQDRILGPLTMVQFIYAVIGGGVCYAIFSTVHAPYSYFIIAPLALFVLAMIFLKINERPFFNFLVSAIEFQTSPKKRFWHHEAHSSNFDIELTKSQSNQTVNTPTKTFSHEQIKNIAQRVDQGQNSNGK